MQKYIESERLDREVPIDLGYDSLIDKESSSLPKMLKGGQVRLDECIAELLPKECRLQESVRKDIVFTK